MYPLYNYCTIRLLYLKLNTTIIQSIYITIGFYNYIHSYHSYWNIFRLYNFMHIFVVRTWVSWGPGSFSHAAWNIVEITLVASRSFSAKSCGDVTVKHGAVAGIRWHWTEKKQGFFHGLWHRFTMKNWYVYMGVYDIMKIWVVRGGLTVQSKPVGLVPQLDP